MSTLTAIQFATDNIKTIIQRYIRRKKENAMKNQ